MAKYTVSSVVFLSGTLIRRIVEAGLATKEDLLRSRPENLFLHYHKNDGDEDGTFAITFEKGGEIYVLIGGLANRWGQNVIRIDCGVVGLIGPMITTIEEVQEK
jgi:hypothetical protein